MSRRVYTYTDLTKITQNPHFKELAKYPVITVSADFRKGLVGSVGIERKEDIIKYDGKLSVAEICTQIITDLERFFYLLNREAIKRAAERGLLP